MKVYRDPWAKHVIFLVVTVTGWGVDPNYQQQCFWTLNQDMFFLMFFAGWAVGMLSLDSWPVSWQHYFLLFHGWATCTKKNNPQTSRQGPSCPKAVYPLWHMVCKTSSEWSASLPFDSKKVEGFFRRFGMLDLPTLMIRCLVITG